MNELIQIEGLTKKYDGKLALDGLSFNLSQGKIIGLLGPNGAGKTTLIKILAGIMKGYEGLVLIDGHSPGAYTKGIVSYLPDKTYLSNWMKIKDIIDIFSDFYSDFDRNKALELLKRLNIEMSLNVSKLSKGTYEKVQLVIVMARKARLYILDEPLGGVDPASRDVIIDTILTNYCDNSTVLLSTQLIADVERVFDEVIILKDGKIFIYDEVDNIRSKYGKSMDELFREVFKCL